MCAREKELEGQGSREARTDGKARGGACPALTLLAIPGRVGLKLDRGSVSVDRTDQHHLAASAFVRANDIPFVTTDLIIVETLNLVQARLGHSPALQLGRRLFQRYREKVFPSRIAPRSP